MNVNKEKALEQHIEHLYGDVKDDPMYEPDVYQSKRDFLAGWEACKNYLNTFSKGEMVEVTDEDHLITNTWFTREFVQKDSDGKYGCKDITDRVSRWTYIRKIAE